MEPAQGHQGIFPANRQSPTPWPAYLALVGAMIFWGSSFIAMKTAFRTLPPMVVIFGRMAIGSFIFLIMIRQLRRVRLLKRDIPKLLALAVFEPCLYFIFESLALLNTTASQAGMITAMLPLMVALAARFILKERLTRKTAAGFLVAIAGATWLSLGAEAAADAPRPMLGNFLEFLAMSTAVGYMILLKILTARYPAYFITAVQTFVGAVFFFPLMFWPSDGPAPVWTASAIGAVVYLGTVVTCGAYGLYNWGVGRVPASQAAAFINLIPVFTVVMGWLILGERFTSGQYWASLLVLAGVFLSQDFGRKAG